MAEAMMPGMGAPEMAPTEPSIDQRAAFEQLREQVSPTEFNREMLDAAEQVDPIAVAEFKRELAALEVAPEVIQMLNTMVDEVLANPGDYPAIREKYLGMGVDEELLPEAFDATIFAALNMALDQMRGPETMMPPQGFAKGGIASLKPMAREMAAAGRYGDTMLAHISPMEAQILRRYGGSGTINPVTGAPEFFLKKMFKSIGKAVKKFASSTVGKIVLGTALFFLAGPAAATMFGTTAAPAVLAATQGFIAGAGTTLLGGGSLKEALKAGAVGGLTAGAFTGLTQGASAFRSTSAPATSQLQAAQQAAQQGTALPDLVTTPDALAMTPLERSVQQGVRANMAAPTTATGGVNFATGQYVPPAMTAGTGAPIQAPTALTYTPPSSPFTPAPATAAPATAAPSFMENPFQETSLTSATRQGLSQTPQPSTFKGSMSLQKGYTPPPMPQGGIGSLPAGVTSSPAAAAQQEILNRGAGVSTGETAKRGILDKILPGRIQDEAQRSAFQKVADQFGMSAEQVRSQIASNTASDAVAAAYTKAASAGLSAYLPMAGLGIAALGATGGFEGEEGQVPPGFEGMMGGQGTTGVELLAKYPERYGLQLGPTQIMSSMPYTSPSALFSAGRPQRYSEGGTAAGAYPRKNGPINGPGTGTSDSIPAMLSDGEFVFTAKAVRAMGEGSRRKGAKRMYALMKKLEGRTNG